jgi:hypothetical protein
MPRFIGVTAFLKVENNCPTDLPARFINIKIDSWEVIHFPFPGSRERRLRVNWYGRLQEKEYYNACKCGNDWHLVGFHVLTLNSKTIESRGFVYATRDAVVGGSQRFSGLGDHSIGTRQKFGQFVAPLLKGLDPHP